MFTKSLVSQALIDATKAIMEEDEKKKMLLEPELDETGFHKAAHAARKAGQSHFEFQGKKYPVTSQPHSEGIVPPEKIGGQVLKKHDDKAAAKGHSAVVRPVKEEDDKKDSPFNWKGKPSQLPKKPGELTGHEHKKTSTGDVYTKKYKKDPEDMKEESHPDEKEDKALVKKMVKPSALKKEEEKETHLSKHSMTNEKYVTPPEARKIADQEVHKHEKNMHKGKKETKLGEEEERHMTDAEMKKREHIVKSMKKGLKGFKARYGDRAKNVMYATATKQAMKEQQEIYTEAFDELDVLEEGKMDKMSLSALWHKHAQHTYGADQGYGGGMGGHHSHHAATAIENHVRKHHGNKCADDMCDHSDHHVSHAEYAGPKEMEYHAKEAAKLRARHGIKGEIHGMHESLQLEDIGGISTISEKKKKMEMKEDEHVRIDGETDMNTKTVDGLRGRMKVPAEYHNKTKSYKVGLTVGEEVEELDEISKKTLSSYMDKAKDRYIKHASSTGLGGSDEKRDSDNKKSIKYAQNMLKAKNKMEEVEIDEGIMDTMKKVGGKVMKTLGHGSDDDMRKDLQRKMGVPQTGKKPTNEEKDDKETPPWDTDKKGASPFKKPHNPNRTGMDSARALAQKAMKKQTKEEVEVDETFKGPEAGSGTGDHPFVTNENSPMKLVKDLAKKSYKKIRQETMMGKIAGGI
jgi:hypothetical protein